jgi:hypothetical protein
MNKFSVLKKTLLILLTICILLPTFANAAKYVWVRGHWNRYHHWVPGHWVRAIRHPHRHPYPPAPVYYGH